MKNELVSGNEKVKGTCKIMDTKEETEKELRKKPSRSIG